jgi:hypothetical protein
LSVPDRELELYSYASRETRNVTLQGQPVDGCFRISVKNALPGSWNLKWSAVEWMADFEASGTGREVRVAMPKPAVLRLRVVYKDRGRSNIGSHVDWRAIDPAKDVMPAPSGRALDLGDPTSAVIVAPPGNFRVVVDPESGYHLPVEFSISAACPGVSEQTLRLGSKGGRVRIRVTTDGRPYTGYGPFRFRFPAPSEERWGRFIKDKDGCDPFVVPGGTVGIEGYDLGDFEPIPLRKVEIKVGESTEVCFEVKKKKDARK